MTAKPTAAHASAHGSDSGAAVTIELLDAGAAGDRGLVKHLTHLLNRIYAGAENGLWREDAMRTTAAELAEHIRAGEMAVARSDEEIVGCVRIWDVGDGRSEFGLLATAHAHRGRGVGGALVAFAEWHSRDLGREAMRLELLVPRGWTHPEKHRLDAWYRRIGYRAAWIASVERAYPQLVPLLATPCDFIVYEKPLTADRTETERTSTVTR